MRSLCLVVVLVACPIPAIAQSTSVVVGNTKRYIRWDEMVGKAVSVQGWAWGAFEKGLGEYLILPNGRVYIHGIDFLKHDANGKLLEVRGILRKGQVRKAPPGAQGYGSDFTYFYIEASSWKPIEKATNPQIIPRRSP